MLILLTNLAQLSCVGELELDLQLGEISRQKSDEKVGFEEVEDSATIRESDSSDIKVTCIEPDRCAVFKL